MKSCIRFLKHIAVLSALFLSTAFAQVGVIDVPARASSTVTPSPVPTAAWIKTTEGSGTTAADSIGSHTGTLSGATLPTWVTGQDGVSGHALSFDGLTSWVSLANAPIMGNSTAGSIVVWFKKASGTIAASQVLYGEGRSSDTTPFLLIAFNTSGQIVAQMRDDSSVSATLTTTTNYNDNAWHMAAVSVASKSSMKLYVATGNGFELAGTDTTTRGTTTINLCSIGSLNRTANALFYAGTAADLKAYTSALVASDILTLSINGTP